MKRTLALLIAVLMVVAILPLSALAAAEQALAGASAPEVSVAPESQTAPEAAAVAAYEAVDVSLGYLSEPLPGGVPANNGNDVAELLQGTTSYATYATIDEAISDLADGMTLKLLADVTVPAITVRAKTWTLDGNGFELHTERGITLGGNAGEVVITDVKLYSDAVGVKVETSGSATVTVTDVTVYAATNAFLLAKTDSVLVVDGKTKAETNGASVFKSSGRLTVKDGEFTANGAMACELLGNSETVIDGGKIVSTGECVARTMSDEGTAKLMVNGGILRLESDGKSTPAYGAAVITNGDSAAYGNVYIYGGQFINANDGSDFDTDTAYSRQVLAQTSSKGNFQIFGGILVATAVQDFFFTVADTQGTGIALPTADLAIVKGVTSKYVENGRTFYYVAYGFGNTLVVPELQKDFAVSFPVDPDPQAPVTAGLVITAALDSIHYHTLLTWAGVQAHAKNGNANDFSLAYGMVITTPAALNATGGSLNEADFDNIPYEEYVVDAADLILNEDGLSFSIVLEDITVQDAALSFIAIPYIELTLGTGVGATTQRYFGEFNTNTDAVSLATLAAAILRDNYAVQTGAYQYPSITMNGSFNRYTEAQQAILQAYIPHEHVLDYKGECQVAGCEYSVAANLDNNGKAQLFVENGSAYSFALTMVKDATYVIKFAKNNVTYTLYDANGAVCEAPLGVYTAAENGTYYLYVVGKKPGNTELTVSHIHKANFKGECSICCAAGENIARQIVVEEPACESYAKDNFYYYNVVLNEGVSYTLSCIGGMAKLYKADGAEVTLKKGVFECTETGTYYIVVEAIHDGEAKLTVNHVHSFNYKGTCTVGDCEHEVLVALKNVYAYMAPKAVVAGDMLYFSINLTAGNSYSINTNRYFGTFKLYDEAGVEISLANDGFECQVDGTYYLAIAVDATVNNAKLHLTLEHDCVRNYRGECVFEHINADGVLETLGCGDVAITRLFDAEAQDLMMEPGKSYSYIFNYAAAGVTYVINLPETGVTYKLYDENGNVLDTTTVPNEYRGAEDKVLYLHVTCTATEEQAVEFSIAHKHEYGYKGECIVPNATRNQPCLDGNFKTLELDVEITENFEQGHVYHFQLTLEADTACKITFANCSDISWLVRKGDRGKLLLEGTGNSATFAATESTTYYLTVTANATAQATLKAELVSDFEGEPEVGDSNLSGDYVWNYNHVASITHEGITYYYEDFEAAVIEALANGMGEVVVLKNVTLGGENSGKYISAGKELKVTGANKNVTLKFPVQKGFQLYHGKLTFENLKLDLVSESFIYYAQGAISLSFKDVEIAASNYSLHPGTGISNVDITIQLINSKIVHKSPVNNGDKSAYFLYFKEPDAEKKTVVDLIINGLETNARLFKTEGIVEIDVDLTDLTVTDAADCAIPTDIKGLTVNIVRYGNDRTAFQYGGFKYRVGNVEGGAPGEVYFPSSIAAFDVAESGTDKQSVWKISGAASVQIERCTHDEQTIPAVPPTCTQTGLSAGKKCTLCDEILEEPQIVPAEHVDSNKDSYCDKCDAYVSPFSGALEQTADHVASITYDDVTYYYESLEKAVADALENDAPEVVLLKDAAASKKDAIVIAAGKALIIKGATGANVTLSVTEKLGIQVYGDLTLRNLTFAMDKLDPAVKYHNGANATFINVTIKPKSSNPITNQTDGSNVFTFKNCTIDFDGSPSSAIYLIYFAGEGTLTVVADGLATEISVAKLVKSGATINLNLTGVTKIGSTMDNFYLGSPKKGEFVFGDSASDDLVA